MHKEAGIANATRNSFEYLLIVSENIFSLGWNEATQILSFTVNGITTSHKVDLPDNAYISIGLGNGDSPTNSYFQLDKFSFDNLDVSTTGTRYYTHDKHGNEIFFDPADENTFPLPGEEVYALYLVENKASSPISNLDIPAYFETSLNGVETGKIASSLKVEGTPIDNPNDYLNNKLKPFYINLKGSGSKLVESSFIVPENGNYIDDILNIEFKVGQSGMNQDVTSKDINIRAVPVISVSNRVINSKKQRQYFLKICSLMQWE